MGSGFHGFRVLGFERFRVGLRDMQAPDSVNS